MTDIITRKQAILSDQPRYFTGKPCGRGHMSERFTNNGVCIDCSEENNAARVTKKSKGGMSPGEVQSLLDRGGPDSREEAEAAGLRWFNGAGCRTHGIVGVKGSCPLCGAATPDPKQSVDLLS